MELGMNKQIEIYKSSTNIYFRFKPEIEVLNDIYHYIMFLDWFLIGNKEFVDYYNMSSGSVTAYSVTINDKQKITFNEALNLYTYLAEVRLKNERGARHKLLNIMQLVIAKWDEWN